VKSISASSSAIAAIPLIVRLKRLGYFEQDSRDFNFFFFAKRTISLF